MVEQVINRLNEVLKTDHDALVKLLFTRTTCSEELLNHPTVQVRVDENGHSLSVLGLLNGLIEEDYTLVAADCISYCINHPNQIGSPEDQCPLCGNKLEGIKINKFVRYYNNPQG